MESKISNQLVDIQNFIKDAPLYIDFHYEESQREEIYKMIFKDYEISLFCNKCKKETIFNHKKVDFINLNNEKLYSQQYSTYSLNTFDYIKKNWSKFCADSIKIKLNCTIDQFHTMDILISINNYKVKKIGQLPSLADLKLHKYSQYAKLFPNEIVYDLKNAIRLYSSGIGIGSYIYIRRVFEFIMEKEFQKRKAIKSFDEEKYHKLSIRNKIKFLKPNFPDIFLEDVDLDMILNKNVFKLKENECLDYFSYLNHYVEFIIDEEFDQYKILQKIKSTQKVNIDNNNLEKLTDKINNSYYINEKTLISKRD